MYKSSLPGPYEQAALGVEYRAIKLQSNASAADLVVTSGETAGIPLHVEPAEIIIGDTLITSGTLTGLLGYRDQPNSGN